VACAASHFSTDPRKSQGVRMCSSHEGARHSFRLSLYKILFYVVICARINRPFILAARLHCPHCCNTIARLLRNIRRLPTTSSLYATHHTIVAMAISCIGQLSTAAAHSARPAAPWGRSSRGKPEARRTLNKHEPPRAPHTHGLCEARAARCGVRQACVG